MGPYPTPKYYGVDQMSSAESEEFTSWYDSLPSDRVFNFQKEMLEYCDMDVEILRKGSLKFRSIVMQVTGAVDGRGTWVDPFDSVTIASVSMAVYKTLFLTETWKADVLGDDGQTIVSPGQSVTLLRGEYFWNGDRIEERRLSKPRFVSSPLAHVPSDGYVRRDQFSKISIIWLEYMSQKTGLPIQHALNGGEKRVQCGGAVYHLDGYVPPAPGRPNPINYTYYGCHFHGCECVRNVTEKVIVVPNTQETMVERYRLTMRREKALEALGYEIRRMWDCEFRRQMESDPGLKTFIETVVPELDLVDRLDPRDAFFGGRTNAYRLHCKVDGCTRRIRYVDFTSLYPSVNKTGVYPTGHPEIICDNFAPLHNCKLFLFGVYTYRCIFNVKGSS